MNKKIITITLSSLFAPAVASVSLSACGCSKKEKKIISFDEFVKEIKSTFKQDWYKKITPEYVIKRLIIVPSIKNSEAAVSKNDKTIGKWVYHEGLKTDGKEACERRIGGSQDVYCYFTFTKGEVSHQFPVAAFFTQAQLNDLEKHNQLSGESWCKWEINSNENEWIVNYRLHKVHENNYISEQTSTTKIRKSDCLSFYIDDYSEYYESGLKEINNQKQWIHFEFTDLRLN